jgi:formylglycine-generating enzyme required for sulfatase activity
VNIPWSFWLSKYEIRNDQYCEYLNLALASGKVLRNGSTDVKTAAALFTGAPANALLLNLGDTYDVRWNVNKFDPVTGMSDRPVSVTWYGALAFAMFYGYDLPTTAEWEKGARGPNHDDAGEHLVYPWGNAISGGYANYNYSYNNSGNSFKSPVGYYNGNQTPFGPDTANGYGLYDVIGNVSEWTRSLATTIETYSQLESLSASHNLISTSTNRLLRGGHHQYDSSSNLKLYGRDTGTSTTYSGATGFRVIRRATP